MGCGVGGGNGPRAWIKVGEKKRSLVLCLIGRFEPLTGADLDLFAAGEAAKSLLRQVSVSRIAQETKAIPAALIRAGSEGLDDHQDHDGHHQKGRNFVDDPPVAGRLLVGVLAEAADRGGEISVHAG